MFVVTVVVFVYRVSEGGSESEGALSVPSFRNSHVGFRVEGAGKP